MSTRHDNDVDVDGGESGDEWCLIESDPAVFTELLELLGCRPGLFELSELYSLDDDTLRHVNDAPHECFGLIFLFEYHSEQQQQRQQQQQRTDTLTSTTTTTTTTPPPPPLDLFFAHQVTTNACATQAVLSVVLNAVNCSSATAAAAAAVAAAEQHGGVLHGAETASTAIATASTATTTTATASYLTRPPPLTDADLGPVLSAFRSFTKDFPPALKGLAIRSSAELRAAHNSFAPPAGSFLADADKDKDHSLLQQQQKGEAFHFVAYVPVHGTVYELDGLQNAPIAVGPVPPPPPIDGVGGLDDADDSASMPMSWLWTARTAIQARMTAVGADAGAVKFNLMAVGRDVRSQYRDVLARHAAANAAAAAAAAANTPTNTTTDDDDDDDDDDEAAVARVQLLAHDEKRLEWTLENQRRRHNYVALAIQVLKELAKHNNSTATATATDTTTAMEESNPTEAAEPAPILWHELLQQAREKQEMRRQQRKQQQQRKGASSK